MEQTVKIGFGEVFEATERAIDRGAQVVIHKGGTGSGKTYDLMIFLFYVGMNHHGKIITVVSESKPHLDIGAIRLFKLIMKGAGQWDEDRWNISQSRYTFSTGTILEFFSADRIGKALGARRDYLFGNEINSLKMEVWDELARRSKYVLGDFNPTSRYWLEDWLANYDNTEVITTNYKHNPYLSPTELGRIEKRAARDSNFRRIHIDCEYGIYEGLVFDDWQQVEGVPVGKVMNGLDFGYTNDPTALIRVVETDDGYYADELMYQTGMLSRDIANRMKTLVGGQLTRADCADPRLIDELKLSGLNVKPSEKGPDSIRAGIDKLKTKKLYVTKRSVNLIRELRNYAWEADRNGQPTNKPIDAFNNAIDAMRYAVAHKGERASDINEIQGIFY